MFKSLHEKLSTNSLTITDLVYHINILEITYKGLLQAEIEDLADTGISRLLAVTAIVDFFTFNIGEKKALSKRLPPELCDYLGTLKTIATKGLHFLVEEEYHSCEYELDKGLHTKDELALKIVEPYKGVISNINLRPFYAHELQAKVFSQIHNLRFPEDMKKALQKAHFSNDYAAQIQLLENLATWCLEKQRTLRYLKRRNEYLMKAALFLNAALVMYRKKTLNLTGEEYIVRSGSFVVLLDAKEQELIFRIKSIEQDFLHLIGITSTCTNWNADLKHRKILQAIRAETSSKLSVVQSKYSLLKAVDSLEVRAERAVAIKDIYFYVAANIKILLTEIIKDCTTSLGVLPCNYALLGLGSLAKEEMTPFSDLEIAILIEQDTTNIREYFYNLSVLLNLRLMGFGETAIPFNLLDINFDEEVAPGLQLDLGGKTPLGRPDQNYELIQTPVGMTEYIKEEAFRRGRLLPIEMGNFTHICGDGSLTDAYRNLVTQELDVLQAPDNRKLRECRALRLLTHDLERFDLYLIDSKQEGKLYQIKHDLYRIPNTILDNLALYLSLIGKNSWERIAELHNYGLTKEAAIYLTSVVSEITSLRLCTYQYYGCQKETLMATFSLKKITQEDDAEYTLNEEKQESLIEVYINNCIDYTK